MKPFKPTIKTKTWLLTGSLSLLVALTGCGGGGGGSTSTNNASLGIYVTDSFRDDFQQVYITLYKIEVGDGAQFRTVFDDAAGKVVNASALANSALLLSSANVPEGTYTRVRVTFEDKLTLVSNGGTGTVTPVDDSIGAHANGKVTLVYNTSAPAVRGSHSHLVIDIDLDAFELVSGRVRPHLRGADDNSFRLKAREAELRGVLSNLTAQGFDLTLPTGQVLSIRLSNTTSVFSGKQGSTASLANGLMVEVKGTQDATTDAILADRVKIEDANDDGGHHGGGQIGGVEAEGSVASVDTTAQSFVVTLREAEGFQPTGGTVTVKVTTSTFFEIHGSKGQPASLANVTAGSRVEATGTFDATTQTLTAQRVEIR